MNRRKTRRFVIWLMVTTGAMSWLTLTNVQSVRRLERVEVLTCPERALARHVIRTVLLADPDISTEHRELIETRFRELHCG